MLRSIKQQVADQLRREILNGLIKSGEYLREVEIAERLNISRGPVREAFGILERYGLIITNPYKGVVVAQITEEEVMNLLLPIRFTIESFAIFKVLPQLRETEFLQLKALVEKMEVFADLKDLNELVELDIQFHRFLIEFSSDLTIINLWNSIDTRIRLYFLENGKRYTNLHQIAEEHRLFLNALMTKDMDLIKDELKKHLELIE